MNESLIDNWIEYHLTKNDDFFWAFEQFNDMVEESPEEAWNCILAVVAACTDKNVLGNLAAGPLEDLLTYHGSEFIDRIEIKARQIPEFTVVVKGVWQNDISKSVWGRVCAIQAKYS